jgi:indolepyruvate ferredoxin oxidoreductase alpha subunit
LVVVVCDDPDGHSSGDETDSRWLARFSYAPLLEPSSIPEAKQLMQWAFDLSTDFDCHVMLRSYTRLSHASTMVELGEIAQKDVKPQTDSSVSISPYLARPKHAAVLKRLDRIREKFETSSFNTYEGPEQPQLMIVCGGSGYLCARDAVATLGVDQTVGILKLTTLWPFPKKWIADHLARADRFLIAEEVDPYIEIHVKETMVDTGNDGKQIFGKESGHIPAYGEITPDRVTSALSEILDLEYSDGSEEYDKNIASQADPLIIGRGLAWCPGCPHRATFWALEKAVKKDRRDAYVTGDIGCYTLDVFPGGKSLQNLLHAMGSGAGLATGLGQLGRFGYDQPVIAVCGDSTFFHGSIPALINAVTNKSNLIQIVLDNQATAMTGFQPHPGTGTNALGLPAPKIEIEDLCRALGCHVSVADPFDVRSSIRTIRDLLKEDSGVRVLIMRRTCELVRVKQDKRMPYSVYVDDQKCKGEECGICTGEFRCPGLVWDNLGDYSTIREDICSGCGVCVDICPFNAIVKEEVA